jgi:hypothetical protein
MPVSPEVQKNLQLMIGSDEYQKHVSSVAWEPSTSQVEWRGGTPDAVFTDSAAPTWTANFVLIQDWENPDSLFNFLLAHAGESAEISYKPVAAGEFSIDATVTLVAPAIGGAVGQYVEATVVMGSTAPVPTFPAPTVPGVLAEDDTQAEFDLTA